ncbi:MAG: O-antigen ligase family protein [Halioglobus sp.]|nr:O-antigen ligase family protein [Halioglobus sp.]
MAGAPQSYTFLRIFMLAFFVGLLASTAFIIDKPILFTAALVGLVGIIPLLQNPRLGLYLTVATVPLDEVGELGQILPMIDISITKIFALVTLMAWALNLAMKKLTFLWRWQVGVLLLYWLWGAITLLDALDTKRGLQELIIQGTTIIFLIMIFNLLRTKRQLLIAILAFTTVSACTFAYAGIQRFLPGSEIAERVGWLEDGEATSGVEISGIEAGSVGTVKRSTGTSAHSNVLGTNTALLVPLLLALMRLTRYKLWQGLALIGVGCCLVGVVGSLSRTGILTYLIILPMLLLSGMLVVTPMRVALASLAGLASLPFLPEGVTRIFDPRNYFSSQSVSVSERFKLWEAGLRAFVENPITGFGFGDNRGIFEFYSNPWNPGLLTVHSTYLQVLIETGIVGLSILMMFFYCMLRMFWRAARLYHKQGDAFGWNLSIAILISLVAFLIMGAIAFDFMRIGFKNMWFLIACGIALSNIAIRQERTAATALNGP